MFIKKLKIIANGIEIRDIDFRSGLNLIVDKTPSATKLTGNNVGKTTVLKLIDYCLGAKANIIYSDNENKKEFEEVKRFLIENEVLITLILVDNINNINSNEIIIERNFLQRGRAIRRINNEDIQDKEFDEELQRLILKKAYTNRPSFREIISHNIRYKDDSINNTLKTLDKYTSDADYEALHLYLFDCPLDAVLDRSELIEKIKQEKNFQERIEKEKDKKTCEIALSMLSQEINDLNKNREALNLNENFENDFAELNIAKYEISKLSSELSKLEIRKGLIEESKQELELSRSEIKIHQLELLYKEAHFNLDGLNKSFADLVNFHNKMIIEKINFISEDLPFILEKINIGKANLSSLVKKERDFTKRIQKSDPYQELEQIITETNKKYQTKGEYENKLDQLNEVEKNIFDLKEKINAIDVTLFSKEFEDKLTIQITKFNNFFSEVSQTLYDERYFISFTKEKNKKYDLQHYKFKIEQVSMSSGKKQGEILCFDLAYIMFADSEQIPCLHFLLNDKKELLHDNQFEKVADFLEEQNIQLVISILKKKVPEKVFKVSHIAVELSQSEKLFKIENTNKILKQGKLL